jgi:disulfide bond formation protein DsbB
MTVAEAPQATAAPTPTTASMADQYFLPVSIAIILAIVIVGAVLALLLLRKRP